MSTTSSAVVTTVQNRLGLKKIPPYWYPYTTNAKQRWINREILEIVSTEFRDRSLEYYRYALECGVTTINGKIAKPDTVVQDGDRIENVVHRHEPPVTSKPVKVLHHDVERDFITVDKPGSIPVHASGRYFKNTLAEILKDDFGYEKVYTVNRLDRLTSGLMIIPLTAKRAASLTDEFMKGTVRKEYIARCKGQFPSEEIVCEKPLLTVDRQMGLNIVHPNGKPAKTIFNRIRYDASTNTSVLHCQPMTGRSHQLRVHLQYLGYPVANDPVYSEVKIWGPNLGKNGIDLTPSDSRSAPAPPPHLAVESNPETPSLTSTGKSTEKEIRLLPRETGQDIGMSSPVPLSIEAVGVITRLRNTKDENEDWSRWRDVVFRAKGRLTPHGIRHSPLPPQNRRRKGGPGRDHGSNSSDAINLPNDGADTPNDVELATPDSERVEKLQITTEEALERLSMMDAAETANTAAASSGQASYCPECYLPLHPDPKPEQLFIFLHALRYTTSLGTFETELPDWAEEGWSWDRELG